MTTTSFKFGLRLKTIRSLVLLEEWLDEHCKEDWSLVLLNMDEMMEKKEIEIRFQNEADKCDFVEYYKKTPPAYSPLYRAEDTNAPAS